MYILKLLINVYYYYYLLYIYIYIYIISMEYKTIFSYKAIKAIISESPTLYTVKVACYVHIVTFVMFGGVLTSSVLFSIIAMYNVLRNDVAYMLPAGIADLNEVGVAIKRMQASFTSE